MSGQTCTHSLAEQDTACAADGLCPLCLLATVTDLQFQLGTAVRAAEVTAAGRAATHRLWLDNQQLHEILTQTRAENVRLRDSITRAIPALEAAAKENPGSLGMVAPPMDSEGIPECSPWPVIDEMIARFRKAVETPQEAPRG